jgi:hypothetical protein
MDNDSYLFIIHVKGEKINSKYSIYDHGFVEINRYGLAAEAFEQEQEVLFNALNVYKVISISL